MARTAENRISSNGMDLTKFQRLPENTVVTYIKSVRMPSEYYLRNRENVIERAKQYYAEHREACIKRITAQQASPEGKERRRKWRESKGIGAFSASTDAWRKKNPLAARDNSRIYVQRRLGRLASAPGTFKRPEWLAKVAYHGWKCIYCSKMLTTDTVTIEHRKPLSKGGSNWVANLAPACQSCNSARVGQRK